MNPVLPPLRALAQHGYDAYIQPSMGGRAVIRLVPGDPHQRTLRDRVLANDIALGLRTYPPAVLNAVRALDSAFDHVRLMPLLNEMAGLGYYVRVVDHGTHAALAFEDRRTRSLDGTTIPLVP